MYRAVVLTTLVLLLLAVAGVSVAQDGRIFAVEPNSDDPPKSTTPGAQTSFEATGSEATTASPLPGASSETDDHRNVPSLLSSPNPRSGSPRSPRRLPPARRHRLPARPTSVMRAIAAGQSVSPSTPLRPPRQPQDRPRLGNTATV